MIIEQAAESRATGGIKTAPEIEQPLRYGEIKFLPEVVHLLLSALDRQFGSQRITVA